MALAGIALYASAIVAQKLIKTNGDVFYGYIAVQNLNGNKIVFRADSSKETVERVITSGGKRFVVFGDGSPIPVAEQRTKSDGKKWCTFKTTHDVEIKWDDVKAVFAIQDKKGIISGLEREYTTNNGNVCRGNFVRQTYGKNSFVELEADGNSEEISLSKVTCYKTLKKNPAQSILEQSKLLDIIEKKNGQWTEPGVIVERNYQSENPDSFYVSLHHANDSEERVYFGQIKKFRKEVNSSYKPYFINVLNKGETMVNGKKARHTVPLSPLYDSKKAKDMVRRDKAFAYKTSKRAGLIGQGEEVIDICLPGKDYMTAVETHADTCIVTFEANDSTYDGLSSVGIVSCEYMDTDGENITFSPFSLLHPIRAKAKPIKDGKSGTMQYKFQIVLPKETKNDKTKPNKYYYVIYVPVKEMVIPLSIERTKTQGMTSQKQQKKG